MKPAYLATLFVWLALGEAFCANGSFYLPLVGAFVFFLAAAWPIGWSVGAAIVFGLIQDLLFARTVPVCLMGYLLAVWVARLAVSAHDEERRRFNLWWCCGVWSMVYSLWFYRHASDWIFYLLGVTASGLVGAFCCGVLSLLFDRWCNVLKLPHRRLAGRKGEAR